MYIECVCFSVMWPSPLVKVRGDETSAGAGSPLARSPMSRTSARSPISRMGSMTHSPISTRSPAAGLAAATAAAAAAVAAAAAAAAVRAGSRGDRPAAESPLPAPGPGLPGSSPVPAASVRAGSGLDEIGSAADDPSLSPPQDPPPVSPCLSSSHSLPFPFLLPLSPPPTCQVCSLILPHSCLAPSWSS